MAAAENNLDILFYSLVLSLQASAMQHMGKVMSPVTGKVERNLEVARHSIDVLEMIQRKTAGNLSDDERKTMEHILYELRLNYVDEMKKEQKPGAPSSEGADSGTPPGGEGPTAGGPTPEMDGGKGDS